MALYVGILDGEKGRFGVRIPDLPGVHGAGRSAEAAISDAMSAARDWCASQRTAGQKIPKARTLPDVLSSEDTAYDPASGDAVVMVNVVIERGRSVKANVSLDAGTLEAIDAEAARQGLTRSTFITSAALEKIERRSS